MFFAYNYAFSKNFNATLEYADISPDDGSGINDFKHFRVVTNVLF